MLTLILTTLTAIMNTLMLVVIIRRNKAEKLRQKLLIKHVNEGRLTVSDVRQMGGL
ncbi:hypothetical protein [uncultured Sphingomonas sp.]|uniref:hypothetical protein n=1 Tax=uncultured Sphingomonas sp. TaxID=158754 RepID=UPI0025D0E512|nr:hypothetical protein [uncultured Sphingomonas sp.]